VLKSVVALPSAVTELPDSVPLNTVAAVFKASYPVVTVVFSVSLVVLLVVAVVSAVVAVVSAVVALVKANSKSVFSTLCSSTAATSFTKTAF